MPAINFLDDRTLATCRDGETVFSVARANKVVMGHVTGKGFHCFGLGVCRVCRVAVESEGCVSQRSLVERLRRIRHPWRLACKTRVYGDITVWTCTEETLDQMLSDQVDAGNVERFQDEVQVDEIAPLDVYDRLNRGDRLVLVDVREPYEIGRACIENAVCIPLGVLPDRYRELPGDVDLVVVCHHGLRSRAAAAFLVSEGYTKALNMVGGIDAWSLTVDGTVPRY